MNAVMVDLDHNFVERDEIRVNLQAELTELLFALHIKRGEIVTKAQLASALWGMAKFQPRTWNRCIDAKIYELRKAIEPLGGAIESRRFEGYVLTWEEWSDESEDRDAKWQRWSRDRVATVVKLREAGASYGQIAARLEVTPSAVSSLIGRMGMQKPAPPKIAPDRLEAILEAIGIEGLTFAAVAERFETTRDVISGIAYRNREAINAYRTGVQRNRSGDTVGARTEPRADAAGACPAP